MSPENHKVQIMSARKAICMGWCEGSHKRRSGTRTQIHRRWSTQIREGIGIWRRETKNLWLLCDLDTN